jgi:hypothetical protein
MDNGDHSNNSARFILFTLTVFLTFAAFVGLEQ